METIGVAASVLMGVVLLLLLYLVVISLPDLARYRRIRGM